MARCASASTAPISPTTATISRWREKGLAAGAADLIAFGKPFIANPDLVERFSSGAPLNDARQGDVLRRRRQGLHGLSDAGRQAAGGAVGFARGTTVIRLLHRCPREDAGVFHSPHRLLLHGGRHALLSMAKGSVEPSDVKSVRLLSPNTNLRGNRMSESPTRCRVGRRRPQ